MDSLSQVPDEEGDVCRVCRTEADEDSPLIYPCKCSGSVRYVHPDCLHSWVQHSQKRHCEICGHSYTFTKVYPSSLPTVIPTLVYIRQSFFALEHAFLRLLRIVVVIWAWLIALPSCNMLALRISLSFGDWILKSSLEAVYAKNSTKINDTLTAVYGNLSEPIVAPVTANEPHGQVVRIFLDALRNFYVQTFLNIVNVLFHPFKLGFALGEGLYRVLLLVENERTITNVLRGQVLSLVLAALLIGVVILRDYMHQHAWTAPPPPQEHEPINPDEWIVRRGVAFRLPWQMPPAQARTMRRHQLGRRRESPVETEQPSQQGRLVHAGERIDDDESLVQLDMTLPRRAASMHLPLPAYDATAPPARPSPRTPNNDVAYSAPEMLAESSTRRRIFWDDNGRSEPDVPEAVLSDAYCYSSPHAPRLADLANEELEHLQAGSSREGTVDRVEGDLELAPPSPAYMREEPRWDIKAPPATRGATYASLLADETDSVHGDVQSRDSEAVLDSPPPATPPDPVDAAAVARLDIDEQLRSIRRQLADREREFLEARADDAPLSPGSAVAREDEQLEPLDDPPAHIDAAEPAMAPLRAHDDAVDEGFAGIVAERGMDRVDGMVGEEVIEADVNDPAGADILDQVIDRMFEQLARPAPQDLDDGFLDQDDWAGNDWAGIFEVIGLLGPMSAMFQNVCFAIIIMSACVGIAIGLPNAIGKFALSTDSIRLSLQALGLLGTATRYLIEPTLQVVYEIVYDVVYVPISELIGYQPWLNLTQWPLMDHLSTIDLSTPFNALDNATTAERVVMSIAGKSLDGFEWIGSIALAAYQASRIHAIDIAASRAAKDQLISIVVGYAVAASGLAALLVAGETGLLSLPESWLKNMRQCVQFVKLASFMVLEIVCFPVGAGLMIGGSISPLIFDAAAKGSVDLLRQLPIGTIFMAWLVGTVFMFAFSAAISHIRDMSRPGALFFIRDPQDESFSPVKDILEKSASSQLRKLSTSFLMYAILIFCMFGATPWLLGRLPRTDILPLRLSLPPISSVPFDLLFLHLGVPPLWTSLRLQDRCRIKFRSFYRNTVRLLNLSSLLLPYSRRFAYFHRVQVALGPDGEMTATMLRKATVTDPADRVLDKAFAAVDRVVQIIFGKYDASAALVRVPARDTVVLLPPTERRGIFIRLDESGQPRTPEDKLQLLKQDRATREARREPIIDYQLVNLPAHWKTRIFVLMLASVVVVSATIATLTLGPLLVGRAAIAMLTPEPVHDGYSMLAGIGISWLSHNLASTARRQINARRFASRYYRRPRSVVVKRVMLVFLRRAYAFALLYGALPLFVGVNWEICVALPARYGLKHGTMVLHVGDAWAVGLALLSAFIGGSTWTTARRGDAALSTRLRRPQHQGFAAVSHLVLPMLAMLYVPVGGPWALAVIATRALEAAGLPVDDATNALAFRLMYPLTSTVYVLFYSRHIIRDYVAKARQRMVDAEYVLEERVENYDPQQDAEQSGATTPEEAAVPAATAATQVFEDVEEGTDDDDDADDADDADADEADEDGDGDGDSGAGEAGDESALSDVGDEGSDEEAADGEGRADAPVLGDEQEVIVFR